MKIDDMFAILGCLRSETAKEKMKSAIRSEVAYHLDLVLNTSTVPTKREINLARDSRKLEAVKSFKERTGMSLMDSKRVIEEHM